MEGDARNSRLLGRRPGRVQGRCVAVWAAGAGCDWAEGQMTRLAGWLAAARAAAAAWGAHRRQLRDVHTPAQSAPAVCGAPRRWSGRRLGIGVCESWC